MIEVAGVTFRNNNKVYYFSPNGLTLKKGNNVIVKTGRGLQYGKVEISNFKIEDSKLKAPLSEVIRVCSKKDDEKNTKNTEEAKEALKRCKELAQSYKLNMMILDANYTFDKSQLLFTFLSENRVDFRKLAKELAYLYKTRIELRQVGVRDKAKEIGGCGPCGIQLCCARFLNDFDSVSINMAKDQNIALNPTKINGLCGRLLCCLKYENDCYKEYSKKLPRVGKNVKTEKGEGKVISTNVLKQTYRVNVKDCGIIEVDVNENH